MIKAHELLLEGTVQAGSTHVPKVFIHSSVKECLNEIMGVRSLSLSKGPSKKCSKTLLCLDNINPVCSVSDAMEALRKAQGVVRFANLPSFLRKLALYPSLRAQRGNPVF